MDWTGILAGALAGFALSLVLWWIQYRVLVPKLEFSRDLSKLSDEDGVVYRFKVRNTGRARGVVDLAFDVQLYLGMGLVRYGEGRSPKTANLLEVFTAVERVMRLRPGVSRVVRFDLRPSRWADTNPRLLTVSGIDLRSTEEVPLERLLETTADSYLQVRVLAYDEVSGSRKFFESQRFCLQDIKVGPYSNMRVLDATVPSGVG